MESRHCARHIPRKMDDGHVRLYIGPGFAYNRVNAHGGNPKKEKNHGN